MKEKPQLQLEGHDGNIYAVMGSAARVLRREGLREEADEMFARVTTCESYYQALRVISEYVQTELSVGGPEIIEKEDIAVNPDVSMDEDGVIACVETRFDVGERFDIPLGPDDFPDLIVTVRPETGEITGELVVWMLENRTRKRLPVYLYPSEKAIIANQMDENARKDGYSDLKEMYEKKMAERATKQKTKERKNHNHDR